MAYTPKTWTTGETITATELNTIEGGLQTAAGVADTANAGLAGKVNSSTYTAGLAAKAPLLTPTATKTAAYTAVMGDLAMMNVAGGATVLTLPTAPADKSQVGYRAIGATTGTPLTVNRGGSDTIGTAGATSATVPLADETLIYQYDAANSRWLAIANVKTKASLDATYMTPWLSNWRTAWAAAKAGTGVAQLVVEGDSVSAGQAATPQTDALIYGWVGRLEALMAAQANIQGVGHTPAGNQPLVAPSNPYTVSNSGTHYDGGFNEVWVPPNNATNTTDVVISLPVHRVTGAKPTSVDVFTLDYNPATTWAYNIDGGTPVTVTVTGGDNGIAHPQLRRITIALDGVSAHTLNLGAQSAANALVFAGHQVHYGTTGLSLFRNAIPGWKGVDLIVGAGSTAGLSGRSSMGGDHLIPWTGVNGLLNAAGPAAPFSANLTIIAMGLNDCTYGSRKDAYEKYLERRVHAARRSVPDASILMVDMPYPSIYSDNASLGRAYNYQSYQAIKRRVADTLGCGYLDLDTAFTQTPVANGYQVSGDVHPTSNGSGAGGADGHLLIAQTIANLIL